MADGREDDPPRTTSGVADASPVEQGTLTSGGARSGRVAGMPTFVAGDEIAGRYRVVRFLAQGGMGEVYEVTDAELGERLALKTVRPEIAEQEGILARFRREIHLARRITHPSVSRIFDIGHHLVPRSEGPPLDVTFLTMELLPGETLSQRIRRRTRLEPAEALPIVRQMVSALATAHEAGIVHRDFKSSNVILVPPSRPGGDERVVVTDFGLARTAADDAAGITGTGEVMGTPAYMAPEQLEGKAVGPPADLYALGVVLYEMLTGRWPFAGSALSVAVKRLTERPPPPRQIVADIDPCWERVILRCLEVDPADRFASVRDVVEALEGGSLSRTVPRRVKRAAAAVAAVLGAGAAVASWSYFRPTPDVPAAPEPSAAPVAAPVATLVRRAVAVVGFRNLGAPESAWLATAIAEMLRTELAAGGRLRTVPGEAVARMKRELALPDSDSLAADTLSRVHRNVGADYVVLGSYLSVKGRLRVDFRLQDATRGELLASASADGAEDDVFDVVSDAGRSLRDALQVGVVSPLDRSAVRAAFPADPAAAQEYSRGLERLTLSDAVGARAHLEKAAALDPGHPMIRTALASALAALGYDGLARREAERAVEHVSGLSREDRLLVEGQAEATAHEWDKAAEIYKALFVFFPDQVDHGLRLAGAQSAAGRGEDALATVAALRRLAPPAGDDPRIDLAEAEAALALTDFARQAKAAAAAALKADAMGARLLWAQARLAEGKALVNLGRLDEARTAGEQAGEAYAAAGDTGGLAWSENLVAVAHAISGNMAGARERFERSLAAFRQIGDRKGIALQLDNLAGTLDALGEPAAASAAYREALALTREVGDRSGEARTLNNLAVQAWYAGDVATAERFYGQALALFEALGETRNVAVALSNIGEVLHRRGRAKEAADRYERSLGLSRTLGDSGLVAETLANFAALHAEGGDLPTARRELEEAAALYKAAGEAAGEKKALTDLAVLLDRMGDTAGAARRRAEAAATGG